MNNIENYITTYDYYSLNLYFANKEKIKKFLYNNFYSYVIEYYECLVLDCKKALEHYNIKIVETSSLFNKDNKFIDIFKCHELNINNENKYNLLLKLNKDLTHRIQFIYDIDYQHYKLYENKYLMESYIKNTYFLYYDYNNRIIMDYFVSDILKEV